MHRYLAVLLLAVCTALPADLPPDWEQALSTVSADSLRGHLSFLASDLLEGRNTPSAGLDIAAEYIAAQFRRAGLEPAAGGGYFQTANWKLRRAASPYVSLASDDRILRLAGAQLRSNLVKPLEIQDAALSVVSLEEAGKLDGKQLRGKILAVTTPELDETDRRALTASFRSYSGLVRRAAEAEPALVLILDHSGLFAARIGRPRLYAPANPPRAGVPQVAIMDPAAIAMLENARDGLTITIICGNPIVEDVQLHNVAGILRGSDPSLNQTAVMVSAHYDHVGVQAFGDGDRIYNGANDNGSGTAAVIELAGALARLEKRPKRSLLFVAFFGEEKGMLGSGFYAEDPPIPLANTVAGLNLEQVGRTDGTEGSQVNRMSVTGYDFSEVGEILHEAGQAFGVEVYKHPKNSDAYFRASDNIKLAQKGVPAHSLTVAFQYSDYHGVGDHWDKIDYGNMATTTRVIGLGMLKIADRDEPPQWDSSNPKTEAYRNARSQ